MEQYISKSAIVAEIERIKKEECPTDSYEGRCKLLWFEQFLSFLDTLEMKEVNLEKETKKWWKEHLHLNPENKLWMDAHQSVKLAKHFFELGLKSKSSYVGIPNIDDTLKEMGVDPDSKSAKSFKEFYYMALEKFKAQKGEEV